MTNSFLHDQSFQVKSPLIMYKGGVSYKTIAKARNHIRKTFNKSKLQYKIQSVFLELAHNVILHSQEQNLLEGEEAVGTFVLDERDGHYLLITGNVVSNKKVESLIDHCERINSLDRSGLFDFKVELSQKELDTESKGGGLGLIQIALLSDNQLEVATERINEEFSYIGFCAKIHKEVTKKERELEIV